MPLLIDSCELIEDSWVRLSDAQAIDRHHDVIVGLDRLKQQRDRLVGLPLELGVVLEPTTTMEEVLPFLDHLNIVLLQFKEFADGRAFSQARLLRGRHAYRGDIRAVGDVLCDQLYFMKCSGFNQFELAEGEDAKLAFRILGEDSPGYQPEWKQSAVG